MEADKFHRAAKDGYLDLLKGATKKDMNGVDEDGNTPTLLAALHGNLDALRLVIMRGGDPNKMDLLGFSALHHAAKNGQMNCVSFLISYGVNIWLLDNDLHSALDIAAMENREDIVKILDDAQSIQMAKNPKVVQSFKEKAIVAADRNAKYYERMQDKANKEMARSRRRFEKNEQTQTNQNGDFTAPTEKSFFKKLTLRMKGNTLKTKTVNGSTPLFSDLVQGTNRGTSRRGANKNSFDSFATGDFKTSEVDEDGRRTLRSMKVSGVQTGGQVMYITERDNETSGNRPALAGVFPGTSMRKISSKSEQLDSGVDSEDSMQTYDEDEEKPGIFTRPMFGQIAFLNRMNHGEFNDKQSTVDAIDESLMNGSSTKRDSGSTESTGTTVSSLTDRMEDLPWQEEDVDNLTDDEEESEYTPVVLFLETCGLANYTHLFTNAEVDMDALIRLTNADFQEMGLQIGPRRKLMDAIERRKQTLTSPPAMTDTFL